MKVPFCFSGSITTIINTLMIHELLGKSHRFEDGDSITIVQIKLRDGNEYWVTYHIQQGPGIPRKLVMREGEFIDTYGHLFGISNEDVEK